jgi:hypothetical protein
VVAAGSTAWLGGIGVGSGRGVGRGVGTRTGVGATSVAEATGVLSSAGASTAETAGGVSNVAAGAATASVEAGVAGELASGDAVWQPTMATSASKASEREVRENIRSQSFCQGFVDVRVAAAKVAVTSVWLCWPTKINWLSPETFGKAKALSTPK